MEHKLPRNTRSIVSREFNNFHLPDACESSVAGFGFALRNKEGFMRKVICLLWLVGVASIISQAARALVKVAVGTTTNLGATDTRYTGFLGGVTPTLPGTNLFEALKPWIVRYTAGPDSYDFSITHALPKRVEYTNTCCQNPGFPVASQLRVVPATQTTPSGVRWCRRRSTTPSPTGQLQASGTFGTSQIAGLARSESQWGAGVFPGLEVHLWHDPHPASQHQDCRAEHGAGGYQRQQPRERGD